MTNKYVGMDRMIEEKKRLDYKYLLIFALLQFPLNKRDKDLDICVYLFHSVYLFNYKYKMDAKFFPAFSLKSWKNRIFDFCISNCSVYSVAIFNRKL